MMNTWPGGRRHAMSQGAHEAWNARHYPGTRQICVVCDQPTGQCEDYVWTSADVGPLCECCFENLQTDGEEDPK